MYNFIEETLSGSRSSLQLLEVKQFLDYVKDQFSQVLLPADTITKQGLLGKGYRTTLYAWQIYNCSFSLKSKAISLLPLPLCSLGAFGVVHKGEMTTSDGDVIAVAIKTIKCEQLVNCACVLCELPCMQLGSQIYPLVSLICKSLMYYYGYNYVTAIAVLIIEELNIATFVELVSICKI